MTDKDKKFIARLLEEDAQAWVELTQQMALGILRSKRLVAWITRSGHEVDEVVSELCIILKEDNMRRVRAINSSLLWWLASFVEVAVRTAIDPKRRRGGGKELPEVLMSGGGCDDEAENPFPSIDDMADENDDIHRSSAVGVSAPEIIESKEADEDENVLRKIVRDVFRRFWSENPKAARVMSLYLQQKLTYAEIGKMMGEKGNTIQQWIYRSKKWWSENLQQELKKHVTNDDADLQLMLMKYLTPGL